MVVGERCTLAAGVEVRADDVDCPVAIDGGILGIDAVGQGPTAEVGRECLDISGRIISLLILVANAILRYSM